ncbi:MAG: hypothetical protein QOG93_1753, partial [Gaiellaceae bacterium]|nr:hypothetical protein [Gaiellaceae bacterium]
MRTRVGVSLIGVVCVALLAVAAAQ